jgi:hypothetical protein
MMQACPRIPMPQADDFVTRETKNAYRKTVIG